MNFHINLFDLKIKKKNEINKISNHMRDSCESNYIFDKLYSWYT